MQLKVFSIRDSKAETYNTPWYKSTEGEALRDFHTAVNDPQSFLNKYPKDFDLYLLGSYDPSTGQFETLQQPKHMLEAIQCVDTKEIESYESRVQRTQPENRAKRRSKK